MNRSLCALALLLAVPFASCDRGAAAANAEVAAEVRALRVALAARPGATPAPTADVANALAPLREALAALLGNQNELQQRQLALTQELQRWSALLADSTRGAQREESAAITDRLQRLEAELRAQEARHREVEKLLQGALDRTADRLEQFLRAVGAEVEPASVPTVDEAPAATPPSDAEGAPHTDGAATPDGERTGRWERGGTRMLWWGGVALVGTFVGFVCVRRWQKTSGGLLATGASAGGAASAPAAVGDPDVQEIWAAAALLGEAVGRLRDHAPEDGTATPSPGVDDEDWIVLDDELLAAPAPGGAADAARPPSPPAEHPRAAPAPATCRLRTDDPTRSLAAVLQVLQHDPRVLRQPEPAVRCAHDSLEVSYRLLPDLPPGERSHVEQRLRDACGGGA